MIDQLANRLGFCHEDIDYLSACYEKMTATPELRAKLDETTELYFCANEDNAYNALLDEIAKETEFHRYTVDLAFLLHAARPLKYIYHVKGIDETIYYDSLRDLHTKLEECKCVYSIVGTFVFSWFRGFYLCRRFALGRLQYERSEFRFDSYKDVLKKGDTVYGCHIPSSGPLYPDDMIDSLKRAYEFYKDDLHDGILPVYCSSNLLHPPTAENYPEGSNLRFFYEQFDVIRSIDDPENRDFWRIFGCRFSPEALKDAPTHTSLQRSIKQMIQSGQPMGLGKSILLFDGEKVVNKN